MFYLKLPTETVQQHNQSLDELIGLKQTVLMVLIYLIKSPFTFQLAS